MNSAWSRGMVRIRIAPPPPTFGENNKIFSEPFKGGCKKIYSWISEGGGAKSRFKYVESIFKKFKYVEFIFKKFTRRILIQILAVITLWMRIRYSKICSFFLLIMISEDQNITLKISFWLFFKHSERFNHLSQLVKTIGKTKSLCLWFYSKPEPSRQCIKTRKIPNLWFNFLKNFHSINWKLVRCMGKNLCPPPPPYIEKPFQVILSISQYFLYQ